jgi:glycosyltransferase involved in cell wall biosynthesis
MPPVRMVISAAAAPGRGGTGLNLCDMVEATRAAVELELFALAPYTGIPTHVVPPDSAAKLLAALPIVRRLRDWHELLAAAAFDRYVAAQLPRSDVVQAVTGRALRTFRAARAYGARCALDCITTHIDNVVSRQRWASAAFGLRRFIHPRLQRAIRAEYAEADVVRVMSEHARETFLERGFTDERLVVVPPVVEVRDFGPTRFDQGRFRVTYVGRLEPLKGFHYLIEAFERLALADGELELWGGPGSRAVAQWLRRRQTRMPSLVIRTEEVQRVGYAQAYGRASVLVHPSLADAYGYVVAEAMACGLPVIVTDQTGAAELVEDGVSGYVVPAADSGAIAERIEHLHAHPELVPAMGAAARRAVAPLSSEAFRSRYLPGVLGLRPSAAVDRPSGALVQRSREQR